MKRSIWTAWAITVAASAALAHGKSPASSTQDTLDAALRPMLLAHQGVVTVAFKHLETGEAYFHDAARPMPSASLIKFPVMVAAYRAAARGDLSLDDPVTLREEDKVPGSGILTEHFTAGTRLTLRDAVRVMIAWSDNTATNLVVEALGRATGREGATPAARGVGAVNDLMEELGYKSTRLNSLVYRGDTSIAPERSREFGLGVMNGAETVDLVERLVKGDLGSGFEKADLAAMRREMLGHLRACQHNTMVPRLLPKGTVVAHKTGAVSDSRCDAGVIESPTGPIAYCVMTSKNEDQSWEDESPAYMLVAEVGKAAFAYFTEGAGAVDAPLVARVLRMGQNDPLVGPMQRTLNARLEPSPNIGVDGDFGPNTQGAVKRFQAQVGLEPTGEADGAFWKALGPLLMEDAPAPAAPEEALATLPPLLPRDPVVGPPIVSCAAWGVFDGSSGDLLWGSKEAEVRDPASTTKIMTAYVVLRIAEKAPAALDEMVTFSQNADFTAGSAAELKEGERVSARELLYGLMLPSGNDASVAFAEHFGGRLPGAEGEAPYDRFVAAMNREAKALGMNETGYRNPHGLTAEGHVTSARDLAKLAHAAMQNPTFREVAATRRRGATVSSVAGYTRNVVWNNTDQLLGYEGFYGVKTGTTDRAGACLVSAGERGGKPLLVVILGATSGENRYLDARNLYRWAWNELGVE